MFVAGFADALADLAQKILFKCNFRAMNPAAFGQPVDVARWYLENPDKCSAAVVEIGQVCGTPGALPARLLLVNNVSSGSHYY